MNRKIAKGADGWYFESQKIEPTVEEIQDWEDQFCDYCSLGSLMPRKGSLAEQCERQVPCPVCLGTGMKDHGKYFKRASNGKVIAVTGRLLDPETFGIKHRLTVEFDLCEPSQQDGRPLHKTYEMYLNMLHVGRAVKMAMLESGKL